MGYTKIFEEIIRSSIWDEDDKTRIVWITLLAMKDRHHFVRGTEEWLRFAARVSSEDCQKALRKLSSPDKNSHSQEEEGRRIKPVPGGWFIVNGEYYTKKLDYASRLEYKASKQAEYRERDRMMKSIKEKETAREKEYRKRKKVIIHEAEKEGATQAIKEGFEEQA
jgi:hypothetical protein